MPLRPDFVMDMGIRRAEKFTGRPLLPKKKPESSHIIRDATEPAKRAFGRKK